MNNKPSITLEDVMYQAAMSGVNQAIEENIDFNNSQIIENKTPVNVTSQMSDD